jgi:capsular polysaccharide transport system permease protein
MSGSTTSLLRSFAIQRHVLGALLAREILTRYGRHNIGFVWLFAEPMLFTLVVTVLWTATRSVHGSSIPIVAFAVTGYSCVLLWRNMPGRCIKAIEPNHALLYHRNVRPFDIFLSRLLLEAGGATISFIVLILFFVAIGWLAPPEDVLLVMTGWVLLAWFGFSMAILLGALSENISVLEKIWSPLSYVAFPLSGVAFVVDAVPPGLQQFVLLLPMTHGTEMVRDGYFGSMFRAHYSITYLLYWCVGLTLLGLAKLRAMQRDISPQ